MKLVSAIALTLATLSVCHAADGDGSPPPGSMANAMQDPAVMEQAMKMMQSPLVMQQMKIMMQDPNVKARMRRMIQRLGADSPLEGADKLADDDQALEQLFERMQVRLVWLVGLVR